jgi:hypothetical protein
MLRHEKPSIVIIESRIAGIDTPWQAPFPWNGKGIAGGISRLGKS